MMLLRDIKFINIEDMLIFRIFGAEFEANLLVSMNQEP